VLALAIASASGPLASGRGVFRSIGAGKIGNATIRSPAVKVFQGKEDFMPSASNNHKGRLTGHALRNANLRQRSLARAEAAPPLARVIVQIRAESLGMTRLEFARKSGISRGTLRDLELGLHTPTRGILQRFLDFCQEQSVCPELLETLRRLYAGPGETLGQFIARLELRAGTPRELARLVGISPATLWEYRRGHFPVPLAMLRKLCQAVDEDARPVELLWQEAERQRLLDKGYPPALAEFWLLCARAGLAEKHVLSMGVSTAAVRRMRYLELPAWHEIADAARRLSRDDEEYRKLQSIWKGAERQQRDQLVDGFGPRLKQFRLQQGIHRRELADLFGIGGKKPARIIKHVEEDGFYSTQAYPAGLAAVVVPEDHSQRESMLRCWQERRQLFHRRHRPETRIDLRLARELYGFALHDMQKILGYTSLEYQRIERGVGPLLDTARSRILQAVEQAGQKRIQALLQERQLRSSEQRAWQSPSSAPSLITLLAKREGGLIPLARRLREGGLKGLWTGRLRSMAHGSDLPPWALLEDIARVCGVKDLAEVRRDWHERYRAQLQAQCPSPLGVELRLLIAEIAPTLRAFSPNLGINYSVLVRDLQRLDRDDPVRWFHVERILRGVGLPASDSRWREIHALWYTAAERKHKKKAGPQRSVASSAVTSNGQAPS
jgi:transcriptional regulator with XRE-family HTH domain